MKGANHIFNGLIWEIVVFRTWSAENLEYTKSQIYEFWYNFGLVLYPFLERGTSDRTLICLDQLLKCSGFIFPSRSL